MEEIRKALTDEWRCTPAPSRKPQKHTAFVMPGVVRSSAESEDEDDQLEGLFGPEERQETPPVAPPAYKEGKSETLQQCSREVQDLLMTKSGL